MNNNVLNMSRIFKLIKNDLILQSKTIFIVAVTLLVVSSLMPFHVSTSSFFYFIMLYVGGFIYTSNVFNDLHDPRKSFYFLTLPSSNLEKFLSKLLVSSVGYSSGLLLAYYVCSWISMVINFWFFHQTFYPLNIYQPQLWANIGKYIILQSMVLLGAIVFKKHALIKTILTVGCLYLVINILAFLLSANICFDCQNGWSISFRSMMQVGLSIFWVVLAPLCWILTYSRISRYELK